jgi:hypothetical protein
VIKKNAVAWLQHVSTIYKSASQVVAWLIFSDRRRKNQKEKTAAEYQRGMVAELADYAITYDELCDLLKLSWIIKILVLQEFASASTIWKNS